MDINLVFDFDDYFRVPTIAVGMDQNELYRGPVQRDIWLSTDLPSGPHELWISHYGKQLHETNDQHDCHVRLSTIKFDGVDLDQLEYCRLSHRGRFYPEYEPSYRDSCAQAGRALPPWISPNHYFGHNGVWRLQFTAPALMWIITEQNPSGMHLEDTIFSTSVDVLKEVKDYFRL